MGENKRYCNCLDTFNTIYCCWIDKTIVWRSVCVFHEFIWPLCYCISSHCNCTEVYVWFVCSQCISICVCVCARVSLLSISTKNITQYLRESECVDVFYSTLQQNFGNSLGKIKLCFSSLYHDPKWWILAFWTLLLQCNKDHEISVLMCGGRGFSSNLNEVPPVWSCDFQSCVRGVCSFFF